MTKNIEGFTSSEYFLQYFHKHEYEPINGIYYYSLKPGKYVTRNSISFNT